jgi:hypothetical protein
MKLTQNIPVRGKPSIRIRLDSLLLAKFFIPIGNLVRPFSLLFIADKKTFVFKKCACKAVYTYTISTGMYGRITKRIIQNWDRDFPGKNWLNDEPGPNYRPGFLLNICSLI